MLSLQVTLTLSLCQGRCRVTLSAQEQFLRLCICTWVSFPTWQPPRQPITEQNKKYDLEAPKQGSLANVGLSVPFPLPHSWPEWEFGPVWSLSGTRGQEQLPG